MNTAPSRPLVPSDLPASQTFIRAVVAYAVAAARGHERPEQVCRTFWPRDPAALSLVERAATAPATTTTSGWASQLAATAVGAFIGSMQESGAARLIEAAPRFEMPGINTITLPRASSTGTPQWIAEGAPIPVAQAVIAAPQLGPPRKLGIIECITREISEASPSDGEQIVGTILRDGLSKQLDLSLFSATAASALRPAGIINGITGSTAAVGGGQSAALADLRTLVDAIVAAGGSGNVMFFASPGRALTLRGYVPELSGQVFGSASIASGVLIGVDVSSFASMFGADPEIRASKEAVVHFEDSAPLPIVEGGVLATPSRGAFQTDVIMLRGILRAAWALRIPGAAAHISAELSW